MSFTSDVKDELTRVLPGCSHCDKATLAALARIEGTLFFSGPGKYRLEIATEIPSVARLAIKSLHVIYGLKTELTVRRSVLHQTPNYLIVLPSQQGLEEALHDLGILGDVGLEMGIHGHLVEKTCCEAAYLRGAFLGSGFIAEPRGDFHFEITVENEALANDLVDLLMNHDIKARVMRRRNSFIVYLKSGTAISEFLAFAGAHQCALAMENERVRKSVRNEINRRVNAEVANQAKSAEAAIDQIVSIRKLAESGKVSELSPGLQEFVKLRLQNPDASLKELGQKANPPLSKSAVYHRVRRIEEIARNL
jgi:DNA-binding protein WhiA